MDFHVVDFPLTDPMSMGDGHYSGLDPLLSLGVLAC